MLVTEVERTLGRRVGGSASGMAGRLARRLDPRGSPAFARACDRACRLEVVAADVGRSAGSSSMVYSETLANRTLEGFGRL